MQIKNLVRKLNLTDKQTHTIAVVAVVLLITGVSIALALLCGNIYKNSAANNVEQQRREASEYFDTLLRGRENFSSVRTASLGGETPALVITSEEDPENPIETWFFAYNGNLCRVKTPAGETVSAETGTPVMTMQSADFQFLQPELLEITVMTEDGGNAVLNIHLPDNGGANE